MSLNRKTAGLSIMVNLLLSWTLLPLLISPGFTYSLRELGEVLIWQGIGAIGWPLALLGGLASLPFQGKSADLGPLLMVVIYPMALLLLIITLSSRRPKAWALLSLHILIAFSFVVVWYQVLHGYEFMKG